MGSQDNLYAVFEHSPQTAKEGVTGHVQLLVGQATAARSTTGFMIPVYVAATISNGVSDDMISNLSLNCTWKLTPLSSRRNHHGRLPVLRTRNVPGIEITCNREWYKRD